MTDSEHFANMPEGMTPSKLRQEFIDTLDGYEDNGIVVLSMQRNKPEFMVELTNKEAGMNMLEAIRAIIPIKVGIPRYSEVLGNWTVTVYPEWATMKKEDVPPKAKEAD